MIIHPYIPKRKPRKPNAKQRALRDSWQKILEKYDVKQAQKPKQMGSRTMGVVGNMDDWHSRVDPTRLTNHIPSIDNGSGNTLKKPVQQYTGDAMIGIGQLHKSNAIPIFQAEDAVDISKMRRN